MGTAILTCLTLYSIPNNSISLNLSFLWASQELFYRHFILEASKTKLGIIPTYLSSISTNTNALALPMFLLWLKFHSRPLSASFTPVPQSMSNVKYSFFLKSVTSLSFLFQARLGHYVPWIWVQTVILTVLSSSPGYFT